MQSTSVYRSKYTPGIVTAIHETMKVWFLFFVLSLNVFAIQPDKVTHFSVSYGVSYTCTHVLDTPVLCPILTLAAGAVKELTDKQFDKKDMIANGIGVGLSLIVLELD